MDWKLTAQRLKKLRNDRKLSHEKLAQLLTEQYSPITANSLKQYEVSDENHSKKEKVKGMKIEYLYNLASFYGVSTDYILGKAPTPASDLDINEIHKKTKLNENTINILIENKNKIPYAKWINETFENIDELNNLLHSLTDYEELYKASVTYQTSPKSKSLFDTKKLKKKTTTFHSTNYSIISTKDNALNLTLSDKSATELMKKITEENFGILLRRILQKKIDLINEEVNKNGKHQANKKQKQ